MDELNRKWWKEAVVYQIYPRSFQDSNRDGIGDIGGIINRLDYIESLGVSVIWLCPVYQSPNDDNGYDISDYQSIMAEFGTLADWSALLDKIHNRGMKLIMDLVVNHTSNEHPWFIESKSSKDSSKRDYYIWRKGKNGKEPNNWESFFTPSAWEYDPSTDEYFLHLFSKKQPDLNWENPKVRGEIFSMMTWWLDQGIDGFRMDVINLISKDQDFPDGPIKSEKAYQSGAEYYFNGPRVHEFLREMNEKVLSHYDVMTVGETPGVSVEDAMLYVGEDRHELNMLFEFEMMGIDSGPESKWDIVPWHLKEFKQIISRWQTGLSKNGWNSLYLNNHDQPRMVSRFGNDKEYHAESAKLLATMLHTLKGTPYIYQGEEIGMTNVSFESINDYKDIETLSFYGETLKRGGDLQKAMEAIYKKGRDNARTPMQWDDTLNAGFTEGCPWIRVNDRYPEINVKSALSDPDSILHYYKKLIQLRKENLIFIYGEYSSILEIDEQIFAYIRTMGIERILVILNFSAQIANFYLPDDININSYDLLIANVSVDKQSDISSVLLKPYEARVYRLY